MKLTSRERRKLLRHCRNDFARLRAELLAIDAECRRGGI